MKLRILIILLVLNISSLCKAQVGHCDYSWKDFDITGILTKNFYTCDFYNVQENGKDIIRIDGIHQSNNYDSIVGLVHILNRNKIEKIPYILCTMFPYVKVIWSENKGINSIDQLSLVQCGSLEYLELTGNKIEKIPAKTFDFQINLRELALQNNQIRSLNENSFDGLKYLKTLNLQSNQISDLPKNVFGPLENLEVLYLNDNKLTTIKDESFGDQDNFNSIFFMRNQITSIDPEFINKIAIQQLDLQGNICTGSSFINAEKTEIKNGLKTCIDNFRPLNQNQVTRPQTKPNLVLNLSQLPKLPEESVPINIPSTSSVVNPNPTPKTKSSCGRPITGQGYIIGGSKAVRGNFPWVAALVFSQSGKFFCGGSVITNRKVITAAHCIQEKHSSKPTLANEFLVLLGVYDLDKPFEVGRISHAVQSVNVHPDWNVNTEAYDADIAVLVLDSEVIFNNFIQPVCAVFPNSNAAKITNAVVVGYGKSEDDTKVHENIPKVLETPIHTHQKCFLFDDVLKRISSGRTFCGGTGNGTGVCKGDSGSGLYVTDGSSYSIRGIVSSSVIGGRYGCDVDSYAVFTDVTKYIDWINGIQTSRFG